MTNWISFLESSIFQYISHKMQRYTVYYIWKLFYMFSGGTPPIIRSANNCIYSIWYLSYRYCYLPLLRQVAVTVWQIPDPVDTVVCVPDDGRGTTRKHVEQFPDKINRVMLHLVGYHHHHHHHHYIQEGLGLIPVPCILKMKLVPPSLPRSSYASSSFWFIL